MKAGRGALGIFLIILLVAGVAAGFVYYLKTYFPPKGAAEAPLKQPLEAKPKGELMHLKMYYPAAGRLMVEDRLTDAGGPPSEAVVREFFKGASGGSHMPEGVRLLGIYQGEDGILYVNLSDEVSRNFHGDAMYEFLLLSGIYESLMSNAHGAADVKLLVDGREIDSLGGHLLLLHPLGETVTQADEEASNE
ncbi:MAG: GerMN domain-containing protein [Thermodesulfovibrionales bacterium]|nr:GerMN domain-containing protein [Thermodesulfovibrionales bacterium]